MVDKKYSIILEKVGNQPLMTTKILCETLGLGLAKAKGMVDKVPTTIATDISCQPLRFTPIYISACTQALSSK